MLYANIVYVYFTHVYAFVCFNHNTARSRTRRDSLSMLLDQKKKASPAPYHFKNFYISVCSQKVVVPYGFWAT